MTTGVYNWSVYELVGDARSETFNLHISVIPWEC